MSDSLIVIPARMASTRFPTKPLVEIAGVSMIRRTASIASRLPAYDYCVATDHDSIADHCAEHNIPVQLTPPELPSGSDRALYAAEEIMKKTGHRYRYIVNLQGDAPLTPPDYLDKIVQALQKTSADMATPYTRLSWEALEKFRAQKTITPFSGTTVITQNNKAIWFSKQIIPALRHEAQLKQSQQPSPICQHIGLYAYRLEALKKFTAWPESPYEKLEGLEQLRALENGLEIATIEVPANNWTISGIDTPKDVERAEALIKKFGDPFFN